ncbi:MAG TPA: KH domain-containing protein, partial [Patescibacteria group bacterium]
MNTVQDTLEYILQSITQDSQEVTVENRDEEGVLILEITAPSETVGQIIGREGRTIKSIRTLLNIAYPQQR